MKVEYKEFYLPSGDSAKFKRLNELGKEGWILCQQLRESNFMAYQNDVSLEGIFYKEAE